MIMCPLLSTFGNLNYLVIYSLHVNFKFHSVDILISDYIALHYLELVLFLMPQVMVD